MERSDQELLRRMAAKDPAALAELYDRHAGRVFGLLLKWLRGRADAEDVLQVTFWEAWDRAGQYDAGRSRPETWLLLIARSRALDRLRRQRPAPDLMPEDEPAAADDPAAGLQQTETAERVRRALACLPEEQRTALCLAFFAGLTHEQIARRLAVPLGTVKTRIRLAMNKLRQLLREP